jgi:ABC-type phosphate transport system permease subunit
MDTGFRLAMLACALAVLGILGLIVYELITRSALSWHAFGPKFFFGSDWNPVEINTAHCHSCTEQSSPPYLRS